MDKELDAEQSTLEKLSVLLKLRYLERRSESKKSLLDMLNKQLSASITLPDLSRYLSGKALPSSQRLIEIQNILCSSYFKDLSFKNIISNHSKTLRFGEIEELDHSYLSNDNRALRVLVDLATHRQLMSQSGKKINLMDLNVDKVLTVEVDGIPIALSIANGLGDVDMTYIRRAPTYELLDEDDQGEYIYKPSDGRLSGYFLPKKSIKSGENILIVDDVIRSGATAKIMVELVKKLGGIVVGILVISSINTPHSFEEIPLLILDNQEAV